jgi:deazaflavin-dependent oxidoreductase (nitroreductase family)
VLNPLVTRLGATTTLWVRGRITGRPHSVPVRVLVVDGERYLVSPRGETDWVKNLRAAGAAELRRARRAPEPFKAVEIEDSDKLPVVQAYIGRYGLLPGMSKHFSLPLEPSAHPVFRIAPL